MITRSDALNGTARGKESPMTLPSALSKHALGLERSDLHLHANAGYVITGTLNLFDQIYMRPQLSDTVARRNS
jgi:hypothetical protein